MPLSRIRFYDPASPFFSFGIAFAVQVLNLQEPHLLQCFRRQSADGLGAREMLAIGFALYNEGVNRLQKARRHADADRRCADLWPATGFSDDSY